MESKDTSFPIPLPQLLRHRNVPDVPEDVDYVMQHLNDPNWDMDQASPTASVSSFPMEPKGTISSGQSIHSSDLDSESQTDSTYKARASSRAQLQEADIDDFNEYVSSVLCCSFMYPTDIIRTIQRVALR